MEFPCAVSPSSGPLEFGGVCISAPPSLRCSRRPSHQVPLATATTPNDSAGADQDRNLVYKLTIFQKDLEGKEGTGKKKRPRRVTL